MRYTSTVKWFNNTRGYGFLNPVPGLVGDVIVHHSEIERETPGEFIRLEERQEVSFEVVQTEKGLRARNVRRVR